jgi:hypothetical protein
MGNAVPVFFDHARKLAAHGLATSGHIVRDYFTGFSTRGAHPGPPVRVTPFAPGSVTVGSALLKLGTSMYAAARNRANYEYLAQRDANDRELKDLQTQKLRSELNQPTYDYTTPTGFKVSGLTGPQRVSAEHDFTSNAAPKEEDFVGETPPDVAAAITKHGGHPPVTMHSKDVRDARTIYGLESPEQLRADARRNDATARAGPRYDPLSEAERSSESLSAKGLSSTMDLVRGEYIADKLVGPNKLPITHDASYLLNPSSIPPEVLSDPRVQAAHANLLRTRARNLTLALGRARSFTDLVSGLSLFQKDDPVLDEPHMGEVAHASLAAARKLATTPEQVRQLDALVYPKTVDQVLNPAPAPK